eukprot:gene1975-7426_t
MRFTAATARITELKAKGADKAAVSSAVSAMLTLKAAHRAKTFLPRGSKRQRMVLKARSAAKAAAVTATYPAPTELERDPDDPTFLKSFAVEDPAAIQHFHTHGFVVYGNVLDQDEC